MKFLFPKLFVTIFSPLINGRGRILGTILKRERIPLSTFVGASSLIIIHTNWWNFRIKKGSTVLSSRLRSECVFKNVQWMLEVFRSSRICHGHLTKHLLILSLEASWVHHTWGQSDGDKAFSL
jgi:hypothetical protein